VIVISVDTLRADHMPTYGYDLPTAPRMAEFAESAMIFDRCYAEASHTLLTHATLMTGVYPETHGVISNKSALPAELPTLAELLGQHGYQTAAFVNCGYFHPAFALDRGFETYDYHYDQERSVEGEQISFGRSAGQTNEKVFEWLDRASSDPFFLFVHYYDVHSDWGELPYEAPAAHRELFETARPPGFQTGDGEVSASQYLLRMNQQDKTFDEQEIAYVRSLYDAGISYTDSEIGGLLDRLRHKQLTDRSIVILLSDHGEEFQDHGKLLHTQVYDELVRVPLMISFPDGYHGAPGSRVNSLVQLSDIVPTLLDYLDIASPAAVQGTSFMPVLAKDEPQRRFAYFRNEDGSQCGIQDGRWKLILNGAEQSEVSLFDTGSDPAEIVDLAKREPDRVRALRAELETWRTRSLAQRPQSQDRPDLDERTLQQLESLGYVGGTEK
jgi:arylsulfatase A-like enzyme